jgi:uncharacterized protein YidB (DUF937 family)
MGLLDDVLGAALRNVAGGAQSAQRPGAAPAGSAGGMLSPQIIMQVLGLLMQQKGGLGGLASSFNQAGLGDVMKSWVGTGQNLPISPAQVVQALGNGTVGQIAKQLGVNAGQAGDLLSKVLPHVVDQLTPGGQIQKDHQGSGDLLNNALGALAGKFFSQR